MFLQKNNGYTVNAFIQNQYNYRYMHGQFNSQFREFYETEGYG